MSSGFVCILPDSPNALQGIGLSFLEHQDKTEVTRSQQEDAALANEIPFLDSVQLARFEQVVLPHLNSAYNLARWLTGNDHDAEDVVQDAYLRAVKFFAGFRGGDGRPWFLTVVRRAGYDWLASNRSHQPLAVFDEQLHGGLSESVDPVNLLIKEEDRESLRHALAELPVEFREVLVLRELEGMSYKEIAAITELPPGTIMSRLSRGRERLRDGLVKRLREGGLI